MPQTPDRAPGESDEEGIILTDRPSGDVPVIPGGIRYVDGEFKFLDVTGVYNPRELASPGGASGEVQFNDGGLFSGSSDLFFNKLTGTLTASHLSSSAGYFGKITASFAHLDDFASIDGYLELLPVQNAQLPVNKPGSYLYTSGSTNDLYFTQHLPGTELTNTVRLRWLEGNLSTGLLKGGNLSTTNGSTTFNVLSGSGIIVSYNSTLVGVDPYPTVKHITWETQSNISLTYVATSQITYVGINSSGNVIQKTTPFTGKDFLEYIVLGRILHQAGSVTNGSVTAPNVSYGNPSWHDQFTKAFGPLKISGHNFYPSGSNLSLAKDAGTSYVYGRNYIQDPDSPNLVLPSTDTATTVSKIFYEYVSGSTTVIDSGVGNAGYVSIDPTRRVNGNGTLVSVNSAKFTIQRVFWFPNSTNRAFFVYFGNTEYQSIADAQNAISTESFTEGDNSKDSAIFLGYIIVKGSATNLTVTNDAKLIQAGLFRGLSSVIGSSGGAGSVVPGGIDTYVQFNDGGSTFGGDAGLTYNKTTDVLTAGSVSVGGTGLLSTSGTSFDLVNTNATTVNFAGSATNLNIGNSLGVNTVRGAIKSFEGISGSLTHLVDGTSYLIAGGNMNVSTGSNGSITLSTINSGTIHQVSAGNGLAGGGSSGNVSLQINDAIVATISGSTFTGPVKFNQGLSGSLTKLQDGTSYLIAGTNISVTTGSNGAVTISNSAPIFYQWNELTPSPRLNTTGSVSFAGGLGSSYAAESSGSDVYFFVSGTISAPTSERKSVFGGDVFVSGSLQTFTIQSTSPGSTGFSIIGSTRTTATSAGRSLTFSAGAGSSTISAGSVTINAGNSGGSSSVSGDVTVRGGNSTTTARGGNIELDGGDTTSSSVSAKAGDINFYAGSLSASTPLGQAGSVEIRTGAAASTGKPGTIVLTSQRGQIIAKRSTSTVTAGSDTFLYITGTIGGTDRSVFAGDVYVSGSSIIAGDLTAKSIAGALTASNVPNGSVLYQSVGISGSTDLFWDNANKFFGVRSPNPTAPFTVNGTTHLTGSLLPGGSELYDIGTSDSRWRDVYARTGSFSGDMTINGNLTVLGSTTAVNSNVVEVGDNIILLNSTASPIQYGGIYVADQTLNQTGSLLWNSNTGRWIAGFFGQEVNLLTTGSTDNVFNKTLSISGLNFNTISGGTPGSVGFFNSSGNLSSSLPGSSGQILVSNGTSQPSWSTFLSLLNQNNALTGSGIINYLPKYSSTLGLSSSQIFDDGSSVGIGVTSFTVKFEVAGDAKFNGVRLGRGKNSVSTNTALGASALDKNTSGVQITGGGISALQENTTGNNNSAFGAYSLFANQSGSESSAFGSYALNLSTQGNNTAVGFEAGGFLLTGTGNLFLGHRAGRSITSGNNNTIIGSIQGTSSLSDTVIISAGTSERLRINDLGNASFGSTNPLGKLHISGSSTGTTPTLLVQHGVLNGSNLPVVDFQKSDGTSLFFLSGSGNIGLGNNNPGFRLQIGANTGVSTSTPETICLGGTYSSVAGSNLKVRLFFDGTNTYGLGVSASQLDYVVPPTRSHVFYGGTSGGEIAKFDGSGNFNLGGTSSARTLISGSSTGTNTTLLVKHGVLNGSSLPVIDVQKSDGTSILFVSGSGDVTLAGNIIMSTPGTGIDFSATGNSSGTMTSEVLDDYEEGTWTPTVTPGTSGTINLASAVGRYTKIGRAVSVQCYCEVSTVSSPLGVAVIGGLPFTSSANAYGTAGISCFVEIYRGTGFTAYAHMVGTLGSSSTQIFLYWYNTSGTLQSTSAARFQGGANATVATFYLTYITDS